MTLFFFNLGHITSSCNESIFVSANAQIAPCFGYITFSLVTCQSARDKRRSFYGKTDRWFAGINDVKSVH